MGAGQGVDVGFAPRARVASLARTALGSQAGLAAAARSGDPHVGAGQGVEAGFAPRARAASLAGAALGSEAGLGGRHGPRTPTWGPDRGWRSGSHRALVQHRWRGPRSDRRRGSGGGTVRGPPRGGRTGGGGRVHSARFRSIAGEDCARIGGGARGGGTVWGPPRGGRTGGGGRVRTGRSCSIAGEDRARIGGGARGGGTVRGPPRGGRIGGGGRRVHSARFRSIAGEGRARIGGGARGGCMVRGPPRGGQAAGVVRAGGGRVRIGAAARGGGTVCGPPRGGRASGSGRPAPGALERGGELRAPRRRRGLGALAGGVLRLLVPAPQHGAGGDEADNHAGVMRRALAGDRGCGGGGDLVARRAGEPGGLCTGLGEVVRGTGPVGRGAPGARIAPRGHRRRGDGLGVGLGLRVGVGLGGGAARAEPAPHDLTGEAELIEPARIVAVQARRQDLALPRAGGGLEALELLDHRAPSPSAPISWVCRATRCQRRRKRISAAALTGSISLRSRASVRRWIRASTRRLHHSRSCERGGVVGGGQRLARGGGAAPVGAGAPA